MPSPYLCERFHPTRGCVSPNFRPETTFSKVAGRVRTADLQTRRLPLNPLLHGGLTPNFVMLSHGQSSYWTAKSSFLFLASDHTEADPNYTLGVDFWTMIFYNLKTPG